MTRTKPALPPSSAPTLDDPHRRCGFSGCANHAHARRFCDGHYRQILQGRPLTPLKKRGGSQPKPVVDRILQNVLVGGIVYEKASPADRKRLCWEWQGSCCNSGYGQISRHGGMVATHRAAYEALVGPIGENTVHHKCGNRACCNPQHLELATMRENVGEMFARKAYVQTIEVLSRGLSQVHRQVDDLLVLVEDSATPAPALRLQVKRLDALLETLTGVVVPHARPAAPRRAAVSRRHVRCRK